MKPNSHSLLEVAYRRLSRLSLNHEIEHSAPAEWQELGRAGAIEWVLLPSPLHHSSCPSVSIGIAGNVPLSSIPKTFRTHASGEGIPVRSVTHSSCVSDSGNTGYGIANTTHPCGDGSIGAFAIDSETRSKHYALTSAHVAAGTVSAAIRDEMAIVGRQGTFRGSLQNWLPVLGGTTFSSKYDVAMVLLDEKDAHALTADSSLLPYGLAQEPDPGAIVSLRRQEGPLAGFFRGYWSGWVNARVGDDGRDYWLDDGLAYELDFPYSQGGDSGAGVWDDQGRLFALHCGGSADNAAGWNGVGCSALEVVSAFRLTLLSRTGENTKPEPLLKVAPIRRTQVDDAAVRRGGAVANNADEIDILARTLWGEARGEVPLRAAFEAIASVVLNRRRSQTYWGKSIIEVCQKPWQFSCWNRSDPNLPKLQKVGRGDEQFQLALEVAGMAAEGHLADSVSGATHYYSHKLRVPPRWASGKSACQRVGNHLFFNNVA